jgi:hypothetical protein
VRQYNTEMAKALLHVIILATTVHTGKIYTISSSYFVSYYELDHWSFSVQNLL